MCEDIYVCVGVDIYVCVYIYIYIYICIYKLLSCAAITDFPDPLLPFVSIVHRSRQVLQATSRIGIELL